MRSQLWLILSGLYFFGIVLPAQAEIRESGSKQVKENSSTYRSSDRLCDRNCPASTVKEWLAQIEAATVQITNVNLNRTERGLEIVLETAQGKPLQIDPKRFRQEGTSLIAEIPNAVLALSNAQTFIAQNPTEEIARVQVIQQDANSIRLSVTGTNALPRQAVTLRTGEFAYSLNLPGQDLDEEIVVTDERQRGYSVPNTSTGTRTDTPLRDVPQSIQVIPQEVLRDQQIIRLDDALRNVPGVFQDFNSGPSATYRIRGFEALNNNLLRNGQVDAGAGELVELSNVERVEVLKGPASVLFGLGNPGGSINIVTKRPLSEPFYALEATVGNYSFYRGAIDLLGPLNDTRTVLYRLNSAYRNSGSFIDFYNSENFNISPVVSVAIGERTNLILEGDYIRIRDYGFTPFVPTVGSVLFNPVGKIPRNRNVGEPSDEINTSVIRTGYQLEHKFSNNWSLRNAFLFNFRDYSDKRTLPGALQADNRTLNRSYREFDFQSISYTLSTNFVGNFSTGSIQHQLLFGVDLNSFENRVPSFRSANAAPLDIFNPIYGRSPSPLGDESSNTTVTNSLGIYLQDQISLTDSLKVLLGGRFDTFNLRSEDFSSNTESSKSDSGFSPRLGIVYQPIKPISLYASYITSFTPASGLFLFGGSVEAAFEPERGRQYEVGIKADLTNRLSATLAFFDLTSQSISSLSRLPAAECRMVKHTMGKTCVPINPQRVVTLSLATLGNVLALDVKPIGTTNEVYHGEESVTFLKGKTEGIKLIGLSQPNLEATLLLKPDLIIGVDWFKPIYPLLSKIAPTVLGELNYSTWENHLSFVAEVLGKQETEKALWQRYYQRIQQLKQALGDRYQDKKISFIYVGRNQIHIDAKNSYAGSIIGDANLQRPASQSIDAPYGAFPISLEELKKADGDILFVTTFSRNGKKFLEKKQQDPLWKTLKAVQENQVYYVDFMSWAATNMLGTDAVIDDLYKYLVNTP